MDRVRAFMRLRRSPTGCTRPAGNRPEGEPELLLAIAAVIICFALVIIHNHAPPTGRDADVPRVAIRLPARAPTPSPTPAAVSEPTPSPPAPPAITPSRPPSRAEGLRLTLAAARSLIGKPYRFGSSGPDAFDCSGFTSFVWRQAGLVLPHNSAAQYSGLPHVPLDGLVPGDLVFSGEGRVTHVGLYVGNGLMIDAPETGRRVGIQPVHDNLIGAARPALLLPN